jgi:hypothetical protein
MKIYFTTYLIEVLDICSHDSRDFADLTSTSTYSRVGVRHALPRCDICEAQPGTLSWLPKCVGNGFPTPHKTKLEQEELFYNLFDWGARYL